MCLFSGEVWRVWTETGAPSGEEEMLSPDTQLILVIYGESGKTEELTLDSDQQDKFLKGATDEFEVCGTDIHCTHCSLKQLNDDW